MSSAATTDEARPATDVLALLTRPSGWGRVRLYGASVAADRVRRRVDTITLVLYAVALAVLVPTARTTDGVEAALAELVASLPTVVTPFAAVPYDLLAVWVVAMGAAAIIRMRWRLVLSLVAAVPIAVAVTLFLNDALGLEGDARDLALGAPQAGVPIQLVLSLAMASIAARELSRPFRTFTMRLADVAVVGALLLPVTSPYRVLCGVLAAGITAGLVRLAFGTPRTTVSASDIQLGLRDLGVETAPVEGGPTAPVRPSVSTAPGCRCERWVETSGTRSSWSPCGGPSGIATAAAACAAHRACSSSTRPCSSSWPRTTA